MKNYEKMIEMIAEACKIALGEEWENMSDAEKHDTIMQVIFTAAEEKRN